VKDRRRGAQQYDRRAASYAAENDTNVFNSLFERPATIALLGGVAGRVVLEVGCGAGPLTVWLLDHGATVVAMDASPRMLDLARQRVGDRARLVLANLEDSLEFQGDRSVDLVVASLVLHYVRDWEAVFSEFRRVLAPGGLVVFSTHHPAMDWQLHSPDDYFAIKQVKETWTVQGDPFEVTFWRRPLTAMTSAIASAGFLIERLVEPRPLPEADQRDADAAHTLRTGPSYLFFRLRAPESASP
jgi:ubiquinone/menaquinone biosynthesis C-methylase UbiE